MSQKPPINPQRTPQKPPTNPQRTPQKPPTNPQRTPQKPPTNPSSNTKKNNKEQKPDVKLLTIFNLIPVFLNTFVKVMPIGLYLASFLESMLFNDIRGFIIFIGLLVNDLINIGYNYMMNPVKNIDCAIIRNVYSDDFFSLATSHTQYISFVTAFVLTSMYFKKVFYFSTFFMFMILIIITIFSRINIGCENMLSSGFNLVFGLFRGIIYYIIVKDFYELEDVTPEDHWLEKKLKTLFPNSDDLDEMFQ